MMSSLEEVRARDGIVISIVSEGDELAHKASDHVIEIPAAPELLEALKETRWLATRQMRTEPFSDQELDRAAQALEMAKLAIEKAKGRAP